MLFLDSSFFKKYFLPGFVFQGVLIAGGYGTGRELVEYFMKYGPLGGLLAMFLVTLVMWSATLVLSFEFSRKFRVYDYRTFLRKIMGPFWFVFEIFYFVLLIIVLGVVGSAAGIILRDNFGFPYFVGVMMMLLFIGFLTFKGTNLLEKFFSSWSILIYIVYGLFFIVAFLKFGTEIQENFSSHLILPSWALGGFKYALYNIGVVPTVLFSLKHIETRKEAIFSGFLAGLIGILPALLLYIAVLGDYPGVVAHEVPAIFVLQKTRIPVLLIAFQIVLFGTLIQTGTGLIHAVNERIDSTLRERGREFPNWQRPLIALLFLLMGLGVSSFGLINLVAKGYGSISWAIFIFYFVPLLTSGLYQIIKKS